MKQTNQTIETVRIGNKDFTVKKLERFILIYYVLGTVLLLFSLLLAFVETLVGVFGTCFAICLFVYAKSLRNKIKAEREKIKAEKEKERERILKIIN